MSVAQADVAAVRCAARSTQEDVGSDLELEGPWDVIIIGTGTGGATLGHALVQAGKRVLFCERGTAAWQPGALKGRYAEEHFDRLAVAQPQHHSVLAQAGREWNEVEDMSGARKRRFVPFMGAGTGGSSALYGMALERFYPADFTPRAQHPSARGAALPEAWPVGYDELAPYYERAERLFRVRGEADPLRGAAFQPGYLAPPPLSNAASELFEFLRESGCHPYRLPVACEFKPGCLSCQGYLCPKACKNDSSRMCLQPALETPNARLLEDCDVLRLEATQHRVTGVVCRYRGEIVRLRAPLVVLAAGALNTPRILFRSASTVWPQGLANRTGLVGKHLMRHYIDLYVVTPETRDGLDAARKELAFNDFYLGPDKLGTVQSFGALPNPALLAETVGHELRGVGRWAAPLVKPIVRRFLQSKLSPSLLLASIIEDLPFAENRVALSQGGGLSLDYRVRGDEKSRIKAMRRRVREVLGPYRPMLLAQAENNERLAHACGTCRFGTDPDTSILDTNNRAHDLDNLYVVDASFFPSSGGINPALTIAANALRVSEAILQH